MSKTMCKLSVLAMPAVLFGTFLISSSAYSQKFAPDRQTVDVDRIQSSPSNNDSYRKLIEEIKKANERNLAITENRLITWTQQPNSYLCYKDKKKEKDPYLCEVTTKGREKNNEFKTSPPSPNFSISLIKSCESKSSGYSFKEHIFALKDKGKKRYAYCFHKGDPNTLKDFIGNSITGYPVYFFPGY